MIKLIAIAALCFVVGQVSANVVEKKVGKNGFTLTINIDNGCCCDNSTESSSEESSEESSGSNESDSSSGEDDRCLGSDNSKIISDAVIKVLDKNGHSYQCIKDLHYDWFVFMEMGYEDWAEYIKENNFDYEGYKELQELIKYFYVCDGIKCEVYYELRLALRMGAANDQLYAIDNGDGTKDLKVCGDVIVLSDNVDDLHNHVLSDPTFTKIVFDCGVFIADCHILPDTWGGMNFVINAPHPIFVMNIIFDVSSSLDLNYNPIGPDGTITFECGSFDKQDYELAFNPSPVILSNC